MHHWQISFSKQHKLMSETIYNATESKPSLWKCHTGVDEEKDDLAKNMYIYDGCALNVDLHSRALLSKKRLTKSTQLNMASYSLSNI